PVAVVGDSRRVVRVAERGVPAGTGRRPFHRRERASRWSCRRPWLPVCLPVRGAGGGAADLPTPGQHSTTQLLGVLDVVGCELLEGRPPEPLPEFHPGDSRLVGADGLGNGGLGEAAPEPCEPERTGDHETPPWETVV